MDLDLRNRIERLYAAMGAVADKDVGKYRPRIVKTKYHQGIYQDFSGGATKAELSNTLHTLIHNVANMRDHLKKWAGKASLDKDGVHKFLHDSDAFCVVCDLSNNDKHGYPPRDGGLSGKAPQLGDVGSCLQMTSSGAMMVFSLEGEVTHSGSQQRIITADIRDKEGNRIGDAHNYLVEAVRRCEEAMERFRMAPPSTDKGAS